MSKQVSAFDQFKLVSITPTLYLARVGLRYTRANAV